MRKIIFDIETTGLNKKEDRIIQIGAVELVDYSITGRTFEVLINPDGKKISSGAFKVHGISDESLKDKPTFDLIFPKLRDFFNDQNPELIAHNANFDVGFINAELKRIQEETLKYKIVDTLAIAKSKHPSAKNDLNSLCKRYGIDTSHRLKHSALLDCKLLADVYIRMVGGLQIDLNLVNTEHLHHKKEKNIPCLKRKKELLPRITKVELDKHFSMIQKIGKKSIWNKYIFDQ
ncbi:DNA polymerase III subunit epsilon [Candidatus Liberibacter americanus]|uniref:DNA polymerase III subunit epsilon n=1 Tax=Candidatus Liberibacter americanus str. Sao Paulo TaxID=1261131 RepID=U6B378_9HYPH|nr:DNA polymerase III subunit epsilon [Candidatus Liberibacter americanus]AHA27514.1 DNA polymerase III epsilon subunit [Candidatus Liberibacter americanus str. Sao Paulo]EMS36524.1 DNA polymerase III subunit epsilon [Candidatus Liberibacter americanus PW_SP]